MRTEDLEAFLWVVRLGGVAAAARQLNLTQPAVTRRIRELERELNVQLFRRVGRGVRLTAAGQTCVELAERIVADVALFRRAAGTEGLLSASIRMGVGEVIALSWLHRLLRRIEVDFPNVKIELDIDLSARLITKLEHGTIDIALLPGDPSVQGSVRTSLGLSPLAWMCRPGFLQQSKLLHPRDLVDVPIITLSPGANYESIMTGWFSQAGVVPRRVDYCNSLTVIASLVSQGFGISLLPRQLFQEQIGSGSLIALSSSMPVPSVQYWAVLKPLAGFPLMERIAELAREESQFTPMVGNRSRQRN